MEVIAKKCSHDDVVSVYRHCKFKALDDISPLITDNIVDTFCKR